MSLPARAPGLVAGLLYLGLQLLLLAAPGVVTLDPEELYNAAHAEAILELGPVAVAPLQYRPFCGGCTADALLGAGLYALLGRTLLSWKLVPVLLGAVGVGAVVQAAWRALGRPAGLAVAALLLATPPAWARLGLVGWGNHFECSALVLVALAVAAGPRRPGWELALGLVLGLGLWIGWSAAFAVVVVAAWLALSGRWAALARAAAGGLLGYGPALLRAALTGESPSATVYHPGELVPDLARLPARLGTLLPPNQLAGLLGVQHPQVGPVLAILAALGLAVGLVHALRRPGLPRLCAGLLLGWIAVYLVVRFPIERVPPPLVPSPGAVRYAAPAMPLAAVLVGLAAGQWWQAGRRLGPVLLLAPWLVAGLGSRATALAPPFPSTAATRMWPGDLEIFREQASWALPLELHAAALHTASPRLRPVHAYALGRSALGEVLTADHRLPTPVPVLAPPTEAPIAWVEGVAAALVDRMDPTAEGGAAELARAATALEALADAGGWAPDTRRAALRELAWRRSGSTHPEPLVSPVGDDAEVAAAARRLAGFDLGPEAEAAAWWAAGRRLGLAQAELWTPGGITLPGALLDPPRRGSAAVAGLCEALGERWGPAAAEHVPPVLRGDLRAVCEDSASDGASRRWRPHGG